MTAIALVGHGVVGDRVERRLPLVAGDVDIVDVDTRTGVGSFDGTELAILAMPAPHQWLAAELIESGIAVVSVSDDVADVRGLLDLDDHARHAGVPLVVGGGMSPGLTGLLARHLADELAAVDELHLSIHGTAGPSCARQHHRALRGRAVWLHDDAWQARPAGSGRELCWFPEPVGAYDCYRAEVAAPILLQSTFPEVRRITARVSANRRDRLTARLPMLSPPHAEGGIGAVRVEARGASEDGTRTTLVAGVAELVGTVAAATAVALAGAALAGDLRPGVVTTGDATLDTIGLLRTIERLGVRLQEFTGVPS